MGTWGVGILQNDTAQDGLAEIAHRIQERISKSTKGSIAKAAQLGAGVGLLLQFSPYSFDSESPFHAKLMAALEANRAFLSQLPGRAGEILTEVLAGNAARFQESPAVFDPQLLAVLHGDEEPHTFLTQKQFVRREDDLFLHPEAIRFQQKLIQELVQEVEAGFLEPEDEYILTDLCREGDFMGAFGLLLILQPDQVAADQFLRWREALHEAVAEAEFDESEAEFHQHYYRLVDLAFDYGIRKAAGNTGTDTSA